MRRKLIYKFNLILETEGKINLLVTTMASYTKQAVPNFTKMLFFPHKIAYCLNDGHDSYKKGNSKFSSLLKIHFLKTTN